MAKIDSLRKEVGQLFQLGLNGPSLTPFHRRIFRTFPPGGLRITPFIRKFIPQKAGLPARPATNLELARTYAQASRIIFEASGTPPIIRDGMEGGEWNCLMQDRFPVAPMFLGYANHDDEALTYTAMSQLARAESSVGLRCSDVMVEINFDRRNPAMGLRTLGGDLDVILRQASIMIMALRDQGILPVVKHFPCQSFGKADTHFQVMRVALSRRELEKSVLVPYRRLLRDNLAVMLSHAMIPAIDNKRPTTLSPAVVTGLLRKELGFEGLIMTDSITMASILDFYPIPEACVQALLAGADQVLLKSEDHFEASIRAVEAAVRNGRISRKRLEASLNRILRAKQEYGLTAPFTHSEQGLESALHSPQAQDFWTGVGCTITRALRVAPGGLPLKPRSRERWLVIESDENVLNRYCRDEWHHANILGRALEERFPEVKIEKRFVPYCTTAEEGMAHIEGAERFQKVIVGAYGYRLLPQPLGVSRALAARKIRHTAVINNPFLADRGCLPREAETVICPFGFFRFQILGAAAMLAGDIPVNRQLSPDLARNREGAW